MPRPDEFADWATEDNYDATAAPYDGEPTKVAITSGQRSFGWIPDQPPAAETDNAQKNLVGRWLRWLDSSDIEQGRDWIEQLANLASQNPRLPGYDVTDLPFVCALTSSAAYPHQGSANNIVRIGAGTLVHIRDDGDGPVAYAYTFDGTDELPPIADAAGATPRADLIAVRIAPDATVDGKRNTVDFQIVQGTPNASPTVPDLPDGYVAYATIVVGASYAHAAGFKIDDTAGAVAVLHDQRMPLGVQDFLLHSGAFSAIFYDEDVSQWREFHLSRHVEAQSGSVSHLIARVPCGDSAGRIVAASTVQIDPATLNCKFVRMKLGTSGELFANLNHSNMNGSGTDEIRRRYVRARQFETLHAPDAGPTVQMSGDGVGSPLWSNGRRTWHDFTTASDSTEISTLALLWNAAANVEDQALYRVQFWVAGR